MFLPDNIDFTQSKKYILSIRLTPSGFYFSIHCPTDSTIFYQNRVAISSKDTYIKNIEKFIFDYSFFTHNYLHIQVIQVNEKSTLIPNEFYNKKVESNLLSFNYHSPTLKVMRTAIDQLDCKMIWEIDESHHNFLSRSLLNPIFKSHLSILYDFFYRLHEKGGSALFINFNDDDMIDAVSFSNEKLILAKTFIARNTLEECFFIQKIWEVAQLDANDDNILFSGKTDNHSASIDSLRKIIPNSNILSMDLREGLEINQSEVPTEIVHQLYV